MTLPNLLLLLFAVMAAATGQIMLKYGMTRGRGDGQPGRRDVPARAAARSLWVWGGLVVFGISALAWLTTLSRAARP